MMDLRVCAVCLSTDVKFYNMDIGQLRQEYNLVSGLRVKSICFYILYFRLLIMK